MKHKSILILTLFVFGCGSPPPGENVDESTEALVTFGVVDAVILVLLVCWVARLKDRVKKLEERFDEAFGEEEPEEEETKIHIP
jgi:hypothetical protein